MKKVVVLIPAYNEEEMIAQVIKGVRRALKSADVLVVDDGSTDNTAQVADRAGAIVLSHPFNMGYGTALQTGYKFAEELRYSYVLQLDGDGQHDPGNLKDILSKLKAGGFDVVIGSRFLGGLKYNASFPRWVGMKMFSRITSFLIRQKITDPTSGYQGFGKDVLRFLTSEFFPCDYPDADVIITLKKLGYQIKEIPVKMMLNLGGKSMHRGLKPFYYVFKLCLSILVTLLRKYDSEVTSSCH